MVNQSHHYDRLSAYLKSRGLQTVWQRSSFAFTASQAALPLLMLWSPSGPTHAATRAASVAISAVGFAGATVWLVRWPTRRESILFAIAAMAVISICCLWLSNPYTGLMGCTTFAMLGGFIAYFHTLRLVLVNFAVATVCAAILAHRFIVATGDVALISAGLITVGALNIGMPFGILSLMHSLRNDLRSSDRDSLTGLHNRRSFYAAVQELMTLHRRAGGTYLVTVVIDLDNFKQLNDTEGHAAGDRALVAVGQALRDNCRSTAVTARMGGEEFVVVDTDTTPTPEKLSERLRQAIAEISFGVTASIGTSAVELDKLPPIADMQLVDDLISTSDAAMYEAKRAGGNQVCHSPGLIRRPAG
ncbi:GGDEF domain-containing protein [Mycobacterium conspicuum]|jgi:diguanylate cyclase (GGDEF)-like protein|uniref:Uncharacterized protein n=1 Tax=Mycobacterium conspicuum TaxID=44010 RepID=A0A1X1TAX5_9MYCO|nr:GGDEF domain-containing protein [Mycobacterium conspicuum]ORV41722.1 diguanylate cyclase [Mycobacterium conspicuum]BBZ40626.1 hypothetical protein MCNS_36890 [Mycobacterium conspicuum]